MLIGQLVFLEMKKKPDQVYSGKYQDSMSVIGAKKEKKAFKKTNIEMTINENAAANDGGFDRDDHEEKGIWMGVAVELKRQKGGQLQDSQEEWLQKLEHRGWLTKVCEGADEAIDWLEKIF
jgi:hypothetical protein